MFSSSASCARRIASCSRLPAAATCACVRDSSVLSWDVCVISPANSFSATSSARRIPSRDARALSSSFAILSRAFPTFADSFASAIHIERNSWAELSDSASCCSTRSTRSYISHHSRHPRIRGTIETLLPPSCLTRSSHELPFRPASRRLMFSISRPLTSKPLIASSSSPCRSDPSRSADERGWMLLITVFPVPA